jgi:hypothetical protein
MSAARQYCCYRGTSFDVNGICEGFLTYRCHVDELAGVWVDNNLAGGDSLEDDLLRLVVPAEEAVAKEPISESSLVDSCATEEIVSAEGCQ